MNSNITSTKSVILDSFTKNQESFTALTTSQANSLSNQVKTTIASLSEKIGQLKQQLGQLTESESTQITSTLDTSLKTILESFSTRTSAFTSDLQKQSTQISSQLKELPDKTIILPTAELTQIDQGFISQQNLAVEILEKFKTSSHDLLAGINQNLDVLFKNIPPTIQEKFTPITEKLKTDLKTLESNVISFKQNVETTYQSSVDQSGAEAATTIQSLIDSIKTNIDSVQTAVSTTYKTNEESVQSHAQKLDTQMKQKISDARTAMDAKIKETMIKAMAPLDKAYKASGEPLKILKDSFEIVMETNLLDVGKTWIIAGQEEVMNYVHEIIERAKSNIILVAPRFDELDWKLILEKQKSGCKFQVITDYLSAKSSKEVQKKAEAGIDLWLYAEHDMIVVVRDREEEILIAPVSSLEDTTAVVSEIGKFVEMFSGMIADYWRRVGKKYTPIGQ
jgi:ElaB/YqjD/DUF883 family membrane-anchored ribosome-binding protein